MRTEVAVQRACDRLADRRLAVREDHEFEEVRRIVDCGALAPRSAAVASRYSTPGPVLTPDRPPGTGKTSVGESIARALNRDCAMSLGDPG